MPSPTFTCGISRSGTTLVTTNLDSDPQASMGYELMPQNLPEPTVAAEAIRATGTDDRGGCSGGFLEVVAETPERVGVSRAETDPTTPYRHVVGIVTDPGWRGLGNHLRARGQGMGHLTLLRRLGETQGSSGPLHPLTSRFRC